MPSIRRVVETDPVDGATIDLADGATVTVDGGSVSLEIGDEEVTYAQGLPVSGASLDRIEERLADLVTIGREILLHLREMTSDNFEGDT